MTSTRALADLLHRRESIIANHPWRDRDPADHLAALKKLSEEITAWANTNDSAIDARLRHFLTNASFAKALAYLEEETQGCR